MNYIKVKEDENENYNFMWKYEISKGNDDYCREKSIRRIFILTPVYKALENVEKTEEQLVKLKDAHFKRIELSDAILVVNVDNYIGNSTNLEIEYAKKLGKEIIYYTDLIKNN